MTEKAQADMRVIRQRQALLREKMLDEFNQSSLDGVGPVGGQQGTKILQEMNSLVVKSLAPHIEVRYQEGRFFSTTEILEVRKSIMPINMQYPNSVSVHLFIVNNRANWFCRCPMVVEW